MKRILNIFVLVTLIISLLPGIPVKGTGTLSDVRQGDKHSVGYLNMSASTPTGEYKTWKQTDFRWRNITFAGGTMAAQGCAVTSIAMLVVHARLKDESNFDPGVFCNYLINNGGFTSTGSIYWGKVSGLVPNFKHHSSPAISGTDAQKIDAINNYMNQGYYVVIQVNYGGHYVALNYVSNDVVYIMDPGYDKTDLFGTYNGAGINSVRLFTAPNAPPTSDTPGDSTPTPIPTQIPVIDLASVEWAGDQIQSLVNRKVISGKDVTNEGIIFAPKDQITRAEITNLIVKAFDIEGSGNDASFDDVTPGAWYYDAVGAAYKSGIISGISDVIFNPEASITRQDMCAIIIRAMVKYQSIELIESDKININLEMFSDAEDIANYAKVYVATAAELKIVNGTYDEKFLKFKPLSNTNRAEAAVVIYRMLEYKF